MKVGSIVGLLSTLALAKEGQKRLWLLGLHNVVPIRQLLVCFLGTEIGCCSHLRLKMDSKASKLKST